MYPLPTADPILKAAAGWAHCVSVTGICKHSYHFIFPRAVPSRWISSFLSSKDKSCQVLQFYSSLIKCVSFSGRVTFNGLFDN